MHWQRINQGTAADSCRHTSSIAVYPTPVHLSTYCAHAPGTELGCLAACMHTIIYQWSRVLRDGHACINVLTLPKIVETVH